MKDYLLSNDKESVLAFARNEKQGVDAKEVIKDPMLLEFLGLKRESSEKHIASAIITYLSGFSFELGNRFQSLLTA